MWYYEYIIDNSSIFMGGIEEFKPKATSPYESADHNKVLAGMFAELEGGIVKIISVDDPEQIAMVQFGKGGDTEWVPFGELRTLKYSDNLSAEWEGRGKQNVSEDTLAA